MVLFLEFVQVRQLQIYLDRIMTRITLAGAFFLAFIAILPTMIAGATHIEGIHFGGTALLIVVGGCS